MERCFAKDEEWTRETVEFLKANTQLSYTQIYKWGWDQKKKVEKNPHARRIPTIDEFGGYCKFENNSNESLSKVLDIDWNEKIRQLDLECEQEERLLKQNQPKENKNKRVKTEDSSEVVEIKPKEVSPQLIEIPDDDSFSTPPKKTKRQRYSSDLTIATKSAPKKQEFLEMPINPFLHEDLHSDYNFEDVHLGTVLNFASRAINVDHIKVSDTSDLLTHLTCPRPILMVVLNRLTQVLSSKRSQKIHSEPTVLIWSMS